MVEASCHCGDVTLELDAAPVEVTDCNCSICRRYGALWAYYPLGAVRVSGETGTYLWDDCSISFHHCRRCGCVTHWSPVDPARDRTGINARLLDPEIVASARVRHLDGADTEAYRD